MTIPKLVVPSLAWLLIACSTAATGVERPLRVWDVREALVVYERAPEPQTLARIAAAVLEAEVLSGDARRSAAGFAALTAAGTHGKPALDRLRHNGFDDAVAARATGLLARLDDPAARAALGEVGPEASPPWLAAATELLDPEHDRAALVARLESPWAAVRAVALSRLSQADDEADSDRELVIALSRVARADPDPEVRALALRALARQGAAAGEALGARFAQSQGAVRMAALSALLRVDPTRARELLEPLLATDPSADAIDAARLVLASNPLDPFGARAGDLLARALAADDAELRARAVAALSALPTAVRAPLARARLAHEKLSALRLALALALPADDTQASAVLRELVAKSGTVGAQAAGALAPSGDVAALARLELALRSARPAERAVAARALARLRGRARVASRALLDDSSRVRVAAASALLTWPSSATAGRRGSG